MNYLFKDFYGGPNNLVQVVLEGGWANVMLLDDTNYNNYINERQFQYHGGKSDISPYNIRPPYQGHWYVVVDRGGYPGNINVKINIF